MIRRFHDAVHTGLEEVVIWGTGRPRRELLHVDDMANACLFVFDLPAAVYRESTALMRSHLNVGYESDVTIAELAGLVASVTGFGGRIAYDRQKPDGTMRKLLDSTRLQGLGWVPSIDLESGIRDTYQWYLDQISLGGVRDDA